MEKIKVALIGYGYWGPNLARVLNELEGVDFKYCVDKSSEQLNQVKSKYPGVITTVRLEEALDNVDAVFVVTPTNTHFKIARECLEAGKHTFIEKPLTSDVKEASELVKIAEAKDLRLMVGHVFLFNPSVLMIKEYIDSGRLGALRHLHFQRRNLGPIRKDINVLWDLAPHDISMALYFIGDSPLSVNASGADYLQEKLEDVVSISMKFANDVLVNIILSWIDPVKIRDVTIVGEKKMILFDDVQPSEKIKIFDKNAQIIKETRDVSFPEYQIALKSGDISIPSIPNKEPLKSEIKHFLDCIIQQSTPLTDGINGMKVVRVLNAVEKSLKENQTVVL